MKKKLAPIMAIAFVITMAGAAFGSARYESRAQFNRGGYSEWEGLPNIHWRIRELENGYLKTYDRRESKFGGKVNTPAFADRTYQHPPIIFGLRDYRFSSEYRFHGYGTKSGGHVRNG
ncbi:MAG TPA: hypothetical protein VN643_05855 [Pyrinomonadaceae bacterium]|nr:hypothetical protein [Pyrinomonadaceae bacterium]